MNTMKRRTIVLLTAGLIGTGLVGLISTTEAAGNFLQPTLSGGPSVKLHQDITTPYNGDAKLKLDYSDGNSSESLTTPPINQWSDVTLPIEVNCNTQCTVKITAIDQQSSQSIGEFVADQGKWQIVFDDVSTPIMSDKERLICHYAGAKVGGPVGTVTVACHVNKQ